MSIDTEPTHTAHELPVQADSFTDPVLAEVRRRLKESTFVAIRRLHCEFRGRVLVLRGAVPTFYTRQIALALVQRVSGVQELDDRITVDGIESRENPVR